jgi:hypothetical protein
MQVSLAFPTGWGSVKLLSEEIDSSLNKSEIQEPVNFRVHESRVLETAILVALISGGASTIAAIIQAAATLASKRSARNLRIEGRTGGQVNLPIDAPPDEVKRIANIVGAMQDPKIIVE